MIKKPIFKVALSLILIKLSTFVFLYVTVVGILQWPEKAPPTTFAKKGDWLLLSRMAYSNLTRGVPQKDDVVLFQNPTEQITQVGIIKAMADEGYDKTGKLVFRDVYLTESASGFIKIHQSLIKGKIVANLTKK